MHSTVRSSLLLRLASLASAVACAHAFVYCTSIHRHQPITAIIRRRGHQYTPLHLQGVPGDGSGDDEIDGGDEEDESLLDELRNIKQDKFGADVPQSDELKEAAKEAEDAFLSAMLEQTRQFRQIKSDEGSDRAVEVFMGRIQEEDEASRRREAAGGEESEGDERDGPGESDDEGSAAWQ